MWRPRLVTTRQQSVGGNLQGFAIVDRRSERALSRYTDHPGRIEERSSGRSRGDWRNAQEIAAIPVIQRRKRRRRPDWSSKISRMFVVNRRRRGRRVWSSNPGGASHVWEPTKLLLCDFIRKMLLLSSWLLGHKKSEPVRPATVGLARSFYLVSTLTLTFLYKSLINPISTSRNKISTCLSPRRLWTFLLPRDKTRFASNLAFSGVL